jgi:uncharacterized protein YjbJ (UPF0337 family)
MKGLEMGFMDKLKNMGQKTTGSVKEKAGKATDDKSLQAEGKGDKASGSLKNAGENIKDAL